MNLISQNPPKNWDTDHHENHLIQNRLQYEKTKMVLQENGISTIGMTALQFYLAIDMLEKRNAKASKRGIA